MEPDITKDKNYIAYNKDLEEGRLDLLKGQYVAYCDGRLADNASDPKTLFEKLDPDKDYFVQQTGIEQRTVHLRSPRIKRK